VHNVVAATRSFWVRAMVIAVPSAERPTHLGRYELLSELGQGAMGVVYRAHDPVLDRVVAIKTINLTLPKDELAEYEARFYQEARAAGGLNHPNIVTIYDIGKSERVAYMAMEFLEGEELRSALASGQPLPLAQALDVIIQVAEGLAYAHERHVVHRDIKPANIMIVRDGLVKITDFGIARMRTTEVKTMTGMIMGSPKYMSPEQVAGRRADHRCDLFSLGVVLYESVTGVAPFQGDNIHGIMYQILNSVPPLPSTRNAELPQIVDLIVVKALAKNVEERYQSAKEMIEDLRECKNVLQGFVTTQPILRSSSSTQPPAPNATRRDDKVLTIRAAGGKSQNEPEKPGLALSKAFDSYEATMRLAAMTGVEKEICELPRALSSAGEANSQDGIDTTWRQPQDGASRAEQNAGKGGFWYYAASIIALAAAAAIFFFTRQ
jgi:eukaryotic-like serine/threonine-protein kinase